MVWREIPFLFSLSVFLSDRCQQKVSLSLFLSLSLSLSVSLSLFLSLSLSLSLSVSGLGSITSLGWEAQILERGKKKQIQQHVDPISTICGGFFKWRLVGDQNEKPVKCVAPCGQEVPSDWRFQESQLWCLLLPHLPYSLLPPHTVYPVLSPLCVCVQGRPPEQATEVCKIKSSVGL